MGRATFSYGEVISGALLAALGVFILTEARKWPYSTPEGPGPGFFPTWYGIAIIALSLAVVVKALVKPEERGADQGVDRMGTFRALSTWAAFAAGVPLLEPLGFVLTLVLLTFFIVTVIFRRSLAAAATTAIAVAAAFYVTFPLALNVALPVGRLGF
jgi:putative tricarboxylic transport membrane protein